MAKPKDTCDPAFRAALDLQLGRIRTLEGTETYQEMCVAANETVANKLPTHQALAAQRARQLQKEAEQAKKEASGG